MLRSPGDKVAALERRISWVLLRLIISCSGAKAGLAEARPAARGPDSWKVTSFGVPMAGRVSNCVVL